MPLWSYPSASTLKALLFGLSVLKIKVKVAKDVNVATECVVLNVIFSYITSQK